MTTVNVPHFFHELFGKKISKIELFCTVFFALSSTSLIAIISKVQFSNLGLLQIIVVIALFLDISGGVIANFSYSTNKQYLDNPKSRLVFIAVHVQPLLLAFILGEFWLPCLSTWAFTIVAALISNKLIQHPAQRVLAATAMATGLFSLLLFFPGLPPFVLLLLLFFMIKVIYSFSVNHYAQRDM